MMLAKSRLTRRDVRESTDQMLLLLPSQLPAWEIYHIPGSSRDPFHIGNPSIDERRLLFEVGNGSGSAMGGWGMLGWGCVVASATDHWKETAESRALRSGAKFDTRPAGVDVEYAADIAEDIP